MLMHIIVTGGGCRGQRVCEGLDCAHSAEIAKCYEDSSLSPFARRLYTSVCLCLPEDKITRSSTRTRVDDLRGRGRFLCDPMRVRSFEEKRKNNVRD